MGKMGLSKIFAQLVFLDGLLFCVHSWNVDHNRLQVLQSGPNINGDDSSRPYYRRSNHITRSANYYNQPRRSLDPYDNRNSYLIPSRKHEDQRSKYANNGRYYKPLEDPSLIYKTSQERIGENPSAVAENQNDGYFPGQEGRMIMRQQGSVTLPYRGASILSRPNSTIIYRINRTRSGRNFRNDLLTSDSNTVENEVTSPLQDLCVKCPAERTVVAKKGRNKVILQMPDLQNCRGIPLPRNVYFKRIYGPRFGTLLTAGSHITVAQVLHNNKSLQICQYRVNVIVQSCQDLQVPRDILMHCPIGNIWGGKCYFRCLKHDSKLEGDQRIICGNDLTWSAQPPKCESTEWCDPPIAPNNGRLDCSTPYLNNNQNSNNSVAGGAFSMGSICKAQCNPNFIAKPKIAKCIQGSWTSIPFCRRRRQRRRLRRQRYYRYPNRFRANMTQN